MHAEAPVPVPTTKGRQESRCAKGLTHLVPHGWPRRAADFSAAAV